MVLLNDFIGVRGRSGSSRGASLIAEALSIEGTHRMSPKKEPRGRVLRLLNMVWWDFVAVPSSSRARGIRTLIHATNTGGRLPGQTSIVVIHDTMVLDHKSMFSRAFRIYAGATFAVSARLSGVVVTPSEHSRSRILARWPKADVRVVRWPAPAVVEDARPLTERHGFLMVSSADRHKRVQLGVRTIQRLRAETGEDHHLSLVLRDGNDSQAVQAVIRQADPRSSWIKIYNAISDEELGALYQKALVLLVTSIDEGYCLPAVEAGAAGLPVAHTGRGSLNEVCGIGVTPPLSIADDAEVIYTQVSQLTSSPEAWQLASTAGMDNARERTQAAFSDAWAQVVRSVTL